MSKNNPGRGNFPAVPFTFEYTCDVHPRDVTWKGRGRKPKELLLQIEHEKAEHGFSVTEQALEQRNPRWQEAAEQKEKLEKIRAEKRAEREKLAAERAARKAARKVRQSLDSEASA